MIKTLLIWVLAFGLGGQLVAEGSKAWEVQDTLWELSYVGVVAMDWSQSRQIQELHRQEQNPLLPRHPTPRTMTAICLGSALGHFGVSLLLPAPWRRRFQVVSVVLEAVVVGDNYFRAGIRLKF